MTTAQSAARAPGRTLSAARLRRAVDLLAARAEEHDRDGSFPYQGVEAVHEAGLARLTVARRYGGDGLGLERTVPVLRELGRGDTSVALVTAGALLLHAEQARTGRWAEEAYLALLADTERGPAPVGLLGARVAAADDPGPRAVGHAPGRGDSPGGGSEVVASATEDGEGWLLQGRERAMVGAEAVAWLVVRAARTGEADGGSGAGQSGAGQGGEGTFLLPADSPGLAVEPSGDPAGLRAVAAQDVLLEGVAVPADACGRELTEREAAESRAWRSLVTAAVLLGTARAACGVLVPLVRDAAPSEPELVAILGELDTRLGNGEDLLDTLAGRVDAAEPRAVARAQAAAVVTVRTALELVETAVEAAGSEGVSRGHPLDRLRRDLLCGRLLLPRPARVLTAAGRTALEPPRRTRAGG